MSLVARTNDTDATWVSSDYDLPVVVLSDPPLAGPDGRFYQKVRYEGRTSFVPFDELRSPDADQGSTPLDSTPGGDFT